MDGAAAAFVPPSIAPGPRYRSVFGWLADFRRDPLAFLERCRRVYGRLAVLRAPPAQVFVVACPDLIQQVLEKRRELYWKGRVFGRIARQAGRGLIFTDGDHWRTGRRLIQPAFTRDRLTKLGEPICAAAATGIERLEEGGFVDGEPVEISRQMSNVALDVAGRALFSTHFGDRLDDYSEVMTQLLEYSNYLINSVYPLPLFVPTRRNRRYWPARRAMNEAIAELIDGRRRTRERHDDLLDLLMDAAADPGNDYMNERQVRDECVTFLGAGHETTGVTLAWTWYLLAQNPEQEARLHEEVDRVLGGRAPGLDDLPALPFTRRVIDESMRLFPAAWALGREAYGGDELDGHPVAKGASVFLSPWVMHRHPDYWDEPERFDPDRFLPEKVKARPRYAYFPFGGGARRCIGDQFALMEMPLVVAGLAQRYSLRLLPNQQVTPDPVFTLRPGNGIWMTLHRRRPH